MLVLCAYYEGDVPEAKRQAFDDHVKTVHLPLVAQYPGLKALRYLKGTPWNGKAPDYYLAFELYFENGGDLERAMSSEVRDRARADVGNFAPSFEGEIRHVLYEVEDVPVQQ